MNNEVSKNVEIFNIDHMGRGIGRLEDKIVFVPNTLKGEIVDIKIINNKKNYADGEVVNFIRTSSDRLESDCPYFLNCGGCDLLHMNYNDQLIFKENKVKELVNKILKRDLNIKTIIKCEENFFYRNKATFKVKEAVGFFKKRTYEIVEIDRCIISDKKINELLLLIKQNIKLNNIESILIRASKNTNESMVVFDVKDEFNKEKTIKVLKDYTDSIIIKSNSNYKTIYGRNHITEILGDNKFIISPDSFFQVNTNQTIRLYNKVVECLNLSKKYIVLDLYCGTGTIGIFLSKYVEKVIGIEINKYAIDDANQNKEINNIENIEFICGDAGKILKNNKIKPSVIVVDPPRSGLEKQAIEQIIRINAEKVVYVSCDPATLARDLVFFKEKYDIKEVTPVDMFPNTFHVECVVLMTKK